MLNADSSAESSEIELQRRAIPPTIDNVAAFRCTSATTFTIDSTDCPGKTSSRYDTRELEASAWSRRPSRESAREISGTNDARAKYATIAARWVPRSAKKRSNVLPTART